MKVCKKCKTHVPNKAKICRNCGADVSKSKIIKTSNTSNSASKGNKNINKKPAQTKKEIVDIKQKALETLTEDIKNEKTVSKKTDVIKDRINKYSEKTNEKISKRKTIVISNFITNSFNFAKKAAGKISKKINRESIKKKTKSISKFANNTWNKSKKVFKKGTMLFSKIHLPTFEKKNSKSKKKKNKTNKKFLIKLPKRENKSIEKVENKKSKKEDKKIKPVTIAKDKKPRKKIDFGSIKKISTGITNKLASFIKKGGKGIRFIFGKSFKGISSLFKGLGTNFGKIFKSTGSSFKLLGKKVSSFPNMLKRNKKANYKRILIVLLLVLSALVLAVFGGHLYEFSFHKKNTVSTQKATKSKVFDMGDSISYNGAEYKVIKIEASQGNSYKSPKEGNQFLIVTISIKNNSDKKLPYSYENWTMSNSKGEEKKRIFTSINVEDALYSGELVIGGVKKGSMVFEQPLNDPKLKMNFYELKKDENDNEEIDTSKRAFSVSIKVPEEKSKDENSQEQTNNNPETTKKQ